MYTMTIDKRPLYDPTRTGYALELPDGMFEANKIGTMTFTIYPDNPEYYSITLRVSTIRVYRDGDIYSVYRPVRARRMFKGGVEYTCEELTALLNDFLHRPAAFPTDPDHGSARDLMELCVSEYNTRSTETRIVPPRDYVLSLYPFRYVVRYTTFSAGTITGWPSDYPARDEEVHVYGWPPETFRRELANVLAVLGYFGNIYIPPSYDWRQVYAALKKYADQHGIACGYRRVYSANLQSYIDWESDDGWDTRVVDENAIVDALNADYQEYIENMPDEEDPEASGGNEQQPYTFSVGLTPAALDVDTGEPIPLTIEKGGYSGYWDYMQEGIVEQLGGYIIPEWGEDSCTLHYMRDEDLPVCGQGIRFGENMVDLIVDTDSEKVYSIIIPLGKDGLTINTDTSQPDTIDNTQPDYISDADAVNMYGKREMTKDWPDIDEPQQLKYTATQWLLENAIRLKDEFDVNALDLRYAGVNVEHLEFMHRVNMQMDRYRINQLCTMTGAKIGYDTPVNDAYHFNGERDSLVDKVRK